MQAKADPVKRRAYLQACAEHPKRHEGPREWSRFLFCMAELMTPDHSDYARFVEGAHLYAKVALEVNS